MARINADGTIQRESGGPQRHQQGGPPPKPGGCAVLLVMLSLSLFLTAWSCTGHPPARPEPVSTITVSSFPA
jgi:UDP-N-acetylmuramyl pentapeptide phosphotransferase/UDP-N-acetylglucosamine-1-phosphate transferase